jgi:nucleotide-binding universal stress UspA family protein
MPTDAIAGTSIVRVLARFVKAHPLTQLLAGALLWPGVCSGLAYALEAKGWAEPLAVSTNGYGVIVGSIGAAGLLGFASVAGATSVKRRRYRYLMAKGRAAKDARLRARAEAEADSKRATQEARREEVKALIDAMTPDMHEILRQAPATQRTSFSYATGQAPIEALRRLADLNWLTVQGDHRTVWGEFEFRAFEILLAHPDWVGSPQRPTRPLTLTDRA